MADEKLSQPRIKRFVKRRLTNPMGQTTPVFLLGCGRSGTSMLIRQLAKSWRIDAYNEHYPTVFENYRIRSLAGIEAIVNRSYAEATVFKPILDSTQALVLLDHFPTARVLFSFRQYHDVVNSSLKKFGVENRINHVRRWMNDDFAEFQVAPPEATKEFIRALWQPDFSPETGAALYWLFYNRLFYDLNLLHQDRVRLVQYEKLVTEPEAQLADVAAFIGVQFDAVMTEGVFASSIGRNDPPLLDARVEAACEALWQQMQQDVLHAVQPAAVE